MRDDDPEIREVDELRDIERRRMSRLRADQILIATVLILAACVGLWLIVRR